MFKNRPRRHHSNSIGHSVGRLEVLESRCVPTLGLLDALVVGNDYGTASARDMEIDAAGNSYLTGAFAGVMDFDPAASLPGDADILTAAGTTDIFVAKYAPDQSLVWARRMGSADSLQEVANGIALDGQGNILVTGRFAGTADFGSISLTSAGDSDGFAMKLTPTGTVTWTKRWGTALEDWGKSIDVDGSGNVYVTSARNYSYVFPDNANGIDILKLNASGSQVWSKYVNTRTLPTNADVAVDAAGNVFVSSAFWGSVDFDPGPKTKYVNSGYWSGSFVLKLKTNGNFQWVSPFIGLGSGSTQGSAHGQSIALDNAGNIFVGGYYRDAVDFNPGSGTYSLPSSGGFIAKLNGFGSFVWAKGIENQNIAGNTFVYGLTTDSANSVYASGSVNGTFDLDPGPGTDIRTSVGYSDAFAMKLTSAGDYAWATVFGSDDTVSTNTIDVAWAIAVSSNGTVYIAGQLSLGTTDLDPDPDSNFEHTNNSFNDFFLLQLNQP